MNPLIEVTHHRDGRVTTKNLSTCEEDTIEPGWSVTYGTSGCAVVALVIAVLALWAVA